MIGPCYTLYMNTTRDPRYKNMQIYILPKPRARLEWLAREAGISMSAVIRLLIENATVEDVRVREEA